MQRFLESLRRHLLHAAVREHHADAAVFIGRRVSDEGGGIIVLLARADVNEALAGVGIDEDLLRAKFVLHGREAGRENAAVVIGPNPRGQPDLFQVAYGLDAAGLGLGPR